MQSNHQLVPGPGNRKSLGDIAQLKMNKKQYEFTAAIYNNEADFKSTLGGAYQTGFKATANWSRATGKTYELLTLIAISARSLPRAVAGCWSSTFKQVQNVVLSQSSSVWKEHGLTEFEEKNNPYGNYVVNRKPPRHFHRPHNCPRDFENTICFANGYMVQMLSADRPDTQRGMNFDQLFGDEVGFAKKTFYTKILIPALRANKYIYNDTRPGRKGFNHPLHWLSVNFSSLPYSIAGRWFLAAEQFMLEEPTKYHFSRANAYDNIQNLPGDYIAAAEKELSDLEFQIEIENKLLAKVPNGFYSSFDDERNIGTRYTYQFSPEDGRHIEVDNWYNTMKPVDMTWDFNGYFTCCAIGQDFIEEFGEYVFNNNFFAKESNTTLVKQVCSEFIEEYKHHIKKVIYLYGDRSGKNRDPDRNENLYASIKGMLRAAGWEVIDQVENTYPSFQFRYVLVNDLLGETKPNYPKIRYHQEKCASLILSTQNTTVEKGTFEKNKKDEGKQDVPQELAPHLTDATDYLLCKKFGRYNHTSTSRSEPIKVMFA